MREREREGTISVTRQAGELGGARHHHHVTQWNMAAEYFRS